MRAKDALGRYGEDLAARHLQQQGLTILDRNFRCHAGELDIVARDGSCLVVVEVKTRRSVVFGDPLEAVTPHRLRRMRHAALRWLEERQVHAPAIRFDVVGIVAPADGPPRIRHLIGVH